MSRLFVVMMLCLVVTTGITVGCSRIQEPWVSSDTALVTERMRPPEVSKQLRKRLLRAQVDR